MKFQITWPLYCTDSLPTLYFTLGISNCNPPLRYGLFPNLKLKGRYKALPFKTSGIKRRSLLLYLYKKLAANLALQDFCSGR